MNGEVHSKVKHLGTRHDMIIQTTASCEVHRAALDPINPPKPIKSFLDAVRSVRLTDIDSIFQFVHLFGTHYITAMTIGSRVGTEWVTYEQAYQEVIDSGQRK